MTNTRLLAVCTLVVVLLMQCNFDPAKLRSAKTSGQAERVWVFAVFNLEPNGEGSYYNYFGAMTKSLYQRIADNKINRGFITLYETRYWNEDEQIAIFEDEQDSGTLTFRIEHLIKLDLEKGDPVLTYPLEQVAPAAIARRQQLQSRTATDSSTILKSQE